MVAAKASLQPFHNRDKETESLVAAISNEPTGVIVLTGPVDTGKTAILRHIQENAMLNPKPSGQKQVFLTVDCRSGGTTDPASFVQQLAVQNDSMNINVKGTNALKLLMEEVKEVKLGQLGSIKLNDSDARAPLDSMVNMLSDWLAKYPHKPLPVICIDEANCLRNWKDDIALRILLNWFVRITKQEKKCHVILATSDTFLAEWLLTKGIKSSQREVVTVGDVTEEEVRGYVYGANGWSGMINLVGLDGSAKFTLPDSLLPAAYQTLGGNIGAWRYATLAAAAKYQVKGYEDLEGAWETVLAQRRQEAIIRVDQAFFPKRVPVVMGEPPVWTHEQWAATLQAIKEAQNHVVSYNSLCVNVGTEAVRSLLNYNYIALRYPSDLAQDLPAEVFKEGTVITAPDAAVLEYILSGAWEKLRSQVLALSDPDRSSSPGQSRSSSPTSDDIRKVADKIAAVEDNIAVIDGRIQQVDADMLAIRTAKEEGWREELAVLQQKQQHLMEKERQLRLFLSQLQEEKLLLMRRDE